MKKYNELQKAEVLNLNKVVEDKKNGTTTIILGNTLITQAKEGRIKKSAKMGTLGHGRFKVYLEGIPFIIQILVGVEKAYIEELQRVDEATPAQGTKDTTASGFTPEQLQKIQQLVKAGLI